MANGTFLTIRKSPLPRPSYGTIWKPGLTLLATLALMPGVARAQDFEDQTPEALETAPMSRPIAVGAFTLDPSIDASVRYDTNIYNTEANTVSDGMIALRPRVSFGPNLARHQLIASFDADLRRYFDLSEENSEQYTAQLMGRLDLANRTTVAARAGFSQLVEKRGSYGDIFATDRPVEYSRRFAGLSATRTGGVIEGRASFDIAEFDYRDASIAGVPVDLDNRNAGTVRATAQATAPVGSRLRGLVQAKYNRITYEQDGGRDSSGKSIMVGVRYQVTGQLDAEAAVGYAVQSSNFTNGDYSGIDYSARVLWSPNARMTVSASWGLAFERSPVAESPSVKAQDVLIGAKYALTESLLAEAETSFSQDELLSIDRSDTRLSTNLRLLQSMGPKIRIFGGAGYRTQSSSGLKAGREYDGWTVSLGARVRW